MGYSANQLGSPIFIDHLLISVPFKKRIHTLASGFELFSYSSFIFSYLKIKEFYLDDKSICFYRKIIFDPWIKSRLLSASNFHPTLWAFLRSIVQDKNKIRNEIYNWIKKERICQTIYRDIRGLRLPETEYVLKHCEYYQWMLGGLGRTLNT